MTEYVPRSILHSLMPYLALSPSPYVCSENFFEKTGPRVKPDTWTRDNTTARICKFDARDPATLMILQEQSMTALWEARFPGWRSGQTSLTCPTSCVNDSEAMIANRWSLLAWSAGEGMQHFFFLRVLLRKKTKKRWRKSEVGWRKARGTSRLPVTCSCTAWHMRSPLWIRA